MNLTIRLTTLLLVSTLAAFAHADPVFFAGTGNYYDFITTSVTWVEAEELSTTTTLFGVQGHLATLTTQEENDFLLDTFGGASGWIGLFQEPGSPEPDQGFGWVTNEELSFTSYNGIEPNNAGGNEQFVEFFNGNWNDLGPTATRRFYVEFETSAIPEPSVLPLLTIGMCLFIPTRRRA